MPTLHHISVKSYICRSDAMTFVGSLKNLELTLTVGYNRGLLWFSLPKIGGWRHFNTLNQQQKPSESKK